MLNDLKSQISQLEERKHAALHSGDATGPDKLLQYFTKVATRALNAERCSIFIRDPETGVVWLKAGTGLLEHDIEVTTKGSFVGKVIDTGETVYETDLQSKDGAHRETDRKTGFQTRNMLCVPIRDPQNEEIVGAIQVLNKKDEAAFSPVDEGLLEEIAEHIQTHVYLSYLDQEMSGLSQKLWSSTQSVMTYLMVAVGTAIVVAIGFAIF